MREQLWVETQIQWVPQQLVLFRFWCSWELPALKLVCSVQAQEVEAVLLLHTVLQLASYSGPGAALLLIHAALSLDIATPGKVGLPVHSETAMVSQMEDLWKLLLLLLSRQLLLVGIQGDLLSWVTL